jgi:hypothetical protein
MFQVSDASLVLLSIVRSIQPPKYLRLRTKQYRDGITTREWNFVNPFYRFHPFFPCEAVFSFVPLLFNDETFRKNDARDDAEVQGN